MFIFVVQTLQKKWNKIRMKQLASGKHMENDCFPRTLKFEMNVLHVLNKILPPAHIESELDVLGVPRKLVKYIVHSFNRKI
jgi:hypothetical protein